MMNCKIYNSNLLAKEAMFYVFKIKIMCFHFNSE